MLDSLTDLSTLHELHLKLQEVNDELDLGPRQIKARENRVKAAEQQVSDRADELKRIRTVADQKGLDLKSREAKIADLTAKLNQATSNKEYDAIKSQIAADEAASSVLEDESLEAMEKVDETIALLAKDKDAVAATEKELADFKAAFAARKVELEAEAADLQQKITASEGIIPSGPSRERYRRLATSMGADAMSPLDDGRCTACFMQVTKENQIKLNQGQIIFCGSCQRLLYKTAEPPVRR